MNTAAAAAVTPFQSLTGYTAAEEEWIVSKAAEYIRAGRTGREAIGDAMQALLAFQTEMAQAKTPRAKLAVSVIIRELHASIRAEAVQS